MSCDTSDKRVRETFKPSIYFGKVICTDCYKEVGNCDCKTVSDQHPVIMHNDGPHDGISAPYEEVPFPQWPLNEKVAFVKAMKQEALARKVVKDDTATKEVPVEQSPVEQVQAERGSCYGDSEFNLGGTALAVTGYLMNKWQMQLPSPITEYDIAMFNALQKINRTAKTPGHKDSLLDTHSFLDLGEKAVQRATTT